jgi:dihydroorotase
LYDLILKGGKVVDPTQEIHGVLDIAIQDGRIASLEPNIAASQGREVLDVSGKLVTPGLVDLHTHVYWGGAGLGVQPERVCQETGVTTFVDAGSAGAGNFLGFKEHVIDRSPVRIVAFLNIAYPGMTAAIYDPENFVIVGENFDLRFAALGPAIEVGRAFPELIRGIKVRLSVETSGDQGVKPLLLAIQAAESLGLPVMAHIGPPPPSRREVLSLLRSGDVLTHAYRGEPNGPLDRGGQILPEMIEARARGVIMDVGHGGSSFSWAVVERMLEQGFLPDVISSDTHRGLKTKTACWTGMPAQDQVTTMSKLLSLGMELEDVIRASTLTPAQVIGYEDEVGSLHEGRSADVAVFELQEGKFEYSDRFSGATFGNRRLEPCAVVLNGKILHKGGADETHR